MIRCEATVLTSAPLCRPNDDNIAAAESWGFEHPWTALSKWKQSSKNSPTHCSAAPIILYPRRFGPEFSFIFSSWFLFYFQFRLPKLSFQSESFSYFFFNSFSPNIYFSLTGDSELDIETDIIHIYLSTLSWAINLSRVDPASLSVGPEMDSQMVK